MTKIFNKKAQTQGGMIAEVVATITIVIILFLFGLVSATLFSVKSEVQQKAQDFSVQSQAENELLSLVQYSIDNLSVSDVIRMSISNPENLEKISSLINERKISLEYIKGATVIEIPDFSNNIKLYYSLK